NEEPLRSQSRNLTLYFTKSRAPSDSALPAVIRRPETRDGQAAMSTEASPTPPSLPASSATGVRGCHSGDEEDIDSDIETAVPVCLGDPEPLQQAERAVQSEEAFKLQAGLRNSQTQLNSTAAAAILVHKKKLWQKKTRIRPTRYLISLHLKVAIIGNNSSSSQKTQSSRSISVVSQLQLLKQSCCHVARATSAGLLRKWAGQTPSASLRRPKEWSFSPAAIITAAPSTDTSASVQVSRKPQRWRPRPSRYIAQAAAGVSLRKSASSKVLSFIRFRRRLQSVTRSSQLATSSIQNELPPPLRVFAEAGFTQQRPRTRGRHTGCFCSYRIFMHLLHEYYVTF
uniref:PID domain-containing protein n=1 Tax=Macrostomum lignano TaxID=282301 RepID=A0A1I8FPR6_9PLAT